MTSIKGHFDGNTVVLDEPATLHVGQAVRVIIEPMLELGGKPQPADDGSAATRLAALSELQQRLGLSDDSAEAWAESVRAERAAWSAPDQLQ